MEVDLLKQLTRIEPGNTLTCPRKVVEYWRFYTRYHLLVQIIMFFLITVFSSNHTCSPFCLFLGIFLYILIEGSVLDFIQLDEYDY